MCTGAEIAVITAAVIGTEETVRGQHQERKAAKSARKKEATAAQDKIIADKEAKVAEQESVATGQTQGIDAANALKALGSKTTTGASIGAGNVNKKGLIGE
jgi:hypothetical protein